jgi:hypothetical protein
VRQQRFLLLSQKILEDIFMMETFDAYSVRFFRVDKSF